MKTKEKSDEFEVFSNALKKVLSVSHSEMQTKLKAKKETRKITRVPRKG